MNRFNYIAYSLIFISLVFWELADNFLFTILLLCTLFVIWGLLRICFYINRGNYNPHSNVSEYSFSPIFGFFTTENLVPTIIFVFSFIVCQLGFHHPMKNFVISVFGVETKAKISESDSYLSEGENGYNDVSYIKGKFKVNDKSYNYYSEYPEIHGKYNGKVIVEYLLINPKINRVKNLNDSSVLIIFKEIMILIFSLILTIVPVIAYYKEGNKFS